MIQQQHQLDTKRFASQGELAEARDVDQSARELLLLLEEGEPRFFLGCRLPCLGSKIACRVSRRLLRAAGGAIKPKPDPRRG